MQIITKTTFSLLLSIILGGTTLAQGLKTTITLKSDTLSLIEVMDTIEKKGGVGFSYTSDVLEPKRKLIIEAGTKSIEAWLRTIFKNKGVEFIERGQLVVLRKEDKPVEKHESSQANLIRLQGQVIDESSGESLPYANIRLGQTSQGFVSNEDGIFLVQLSSRFKSDTLVFSYVGYRNTKIPIASFKSKPLTVTMKEDVRLMASVEVKPIDPVVLVREAIGKAKENYHSEPVYLDAYYRELVKVDSNFVKFADAACQLYYQGYDTGQPLIREFDTFSPDFTFWFPGIINERRREGDQVKILQSRASNNYQVIRQKFMTLDFEQFNVRGGPAALIGMDYVKIPKGFLDTVQMKYYQFELEESVSINERLAYVVSFTPRSKNVKKSFHQGKMYIDDETRAVVSFEFEVAPANRKNLDKKVGWIKFIGEVPKKLKPFFEGKGAFRRRMSDYNYQVKVDYQLYQDKWYLSAIKKQAFYRNSGNIIDDIYSEAISELVVNRIDTKEAKPYNKADQFTGYLFFHPVDYDRQFWQQYNAVVPTGIFGKALMDLEKEKSLDQQFIENVTKDTTLTPPVARRVTEVTRIHDQELSDDYRWLHDRYDDEVQEYIEKENAYTRNHFIPLKGLRRTLYTEMTERVEKNYQTLPVKIGDYYYYSRLTDSLEYALIYRKQGSLKNQEELVVDINALAEGREYYDFSIAGPNTQHTIVSYFENLTGGSEDVLKFLSLEEGMEVSDSLLQVDDMVWFQDGKSFLYTRKDSTDRSYQVYLHELGLAQEKDRLIYEETDATFSVGVSRSKSKEFLFITSTSSNESEVRLLSASGSNTDLRLVTEREPGHDYSIQHTSDGFYMISNKNAPNYQVWHVEQWKEGEANWEVFSPHKPGSLITQMAFFDNYVVLNEKSNARDRIKVIDKQTGKSHYIKFKGDIHSISLGTNTETQTDSLRVIYSDPITPTITYAYNMKTRKKKVLDQRKIQSPFDPKEYRMERIEVIARDGEKVPVTLIYGKNALKKAVLKINGKKSYGEREMYLTAYGAYGVASEAGFSYSRLSLLDRGVVYAIAHVRGGGDKGSEWYLKGKMLSKKNTFTDFIDVAEYLISEDYIEKGNIVASGGSAGGLLMGVVANERPELFKGIVLNVPFLDVMNTMLDSSLPLTTGEYKEWGNPNEQEHFDYMRSYSPYDNVKKQAYPAMLFTSAFNDANVPYWEAVKMVAKLRAYNTGENEILLKVSNQGGHGGGSARFAGFSEAAFEYAFVLDLFGR